MTSNELKAKFEASQEKVAKRFNTIQKVCKKLGLNDTEVLLAYSEIAKETKTTYFPSRVSKEIVLSFIQHTNDWDIDSVIEQLIENLCKYYEVCLVCKNWETKYLTQLNKEETPKIKVLWDFLTRWENNAREWYIRNSKLYYDLYTNEDKEWEAYKTTKEYQEEMDYIQYLYPHSQKWSIEYKVERRWKERYYEDINMFTKDITHGSKEHRIDMERLNKFLAQEKTHKYEDLCNRITSVVGEILDVSNLSIGEKQGELNGIVIGSKAKAKVETISAGGWNIQCFHYRTLVNKVKA